MSKKHMILLMVGMSLAACGTIPEDRAISGAGIGAAGGAIIGAVTGLTVVQGAAIGAVTGALTGALTDKDKVNLGKPVWRQSTASTSRKSAAPATADHAVDAPATDNQSVAASGSDHNTVASGASDHQKVTVSNSPALAADKRLVVEIQHGLIRLGYNPGPVDGINGKRTRKAIRDYQQYHGLIVDGQASLELAEHIRLRNYYLGGVNVQQTSYPL